MRGTVGQQLLTMLQSQYDGCSLNALHNILCVSPQNVYQIAHGERSMSTDTILIACDILGVDPQPWLIQSEIDTCRSPKRRQILERILAKMDTATGRAAVGLLAFLLVGDFGGF